jgi:hypothetical protein
MPNDTKPNQPVPDDGTLREDEPIPSASDDKVLDETVRMAREGRQQLDSDPKERKPASE